MMQIFKHSPEEFSHGASGVWGQILQRSRIRGSGGYDNGVVDSTAVRQTFDDLCDGGSLLTDSDVNAVQFLLLFSGVIEAFLIDNGIDGKSSFSSLPVSDNQLTLATTDGHQGVHGFDSSLHGLSDRYSVKKVDYVTFKYFDDHIHIILITFCIKETEQRHNHHYKLPRNNAWSFRSNTEPQFVVERSLAIDGIAQSIDDTTQQFFAHGNVDDGTGTFDNVTLLNVSVITEYDNTDIVRLQIQRHALQSRAEFHHLVGLDVLQPVYTRDTIPNAEHSTSLFEIGLESGQIFVKHYTIFTNISK